MHEEPRELRPEEFRFKTDVSVRFRDLDAMGHVNNAVYLTYFESGREGYVDALGYAPPEAPPQQRFPFIMLDAYCRYVSAVHAGERLEVHVRTARMGGKSFEVEYLITSTSDARVVATGRSTLVYFDYESGRTEAIPGDFRRRVVELEGHDPSAKS